MGAACLGHRGVSLPKVCALGAQPTSPCTPLILRLWVGAYFTVLPRCVLEGRMWVCLCVHAQSLSCVKHLATPWLVACHSPLSMGFSRQEYWSGSPFPSPEDLPNPGIKPISPSSPALQADSLPLSHLGSPEGRTLCSKGHSGDPEFYFIRSETLGVSVYSPLCMHEVSETQGLQQMQNWGSSLQV